MLLLLLSKHKRLDVSLPVSLLFISKYSTSWIKYLSPSSYHKAAEFLLKLGIYEKAQRSGAEVLANQIELILKAPFQVAVPTLEVDQWILPIMLASEDRRAQEDEGVIVEMQQQEEQLENAPMIDLSFPYSQQIFSRIPVLLPYESPIFECVQNGDIDGMRRLLTSGTTSIDAVDPYGLGLLYVGVSFNIRSLS